MKLYGVYLMCSYPRTGAIYTGMSGNLIKRTKQNAGLEEGGSAWALKYKARHVVYYEIVDDYVLAREREAKLKKWDREVKMQMIANFNPAWTDVRWEMEKKLAAV